jgi:hypothetical protein
VYQWNLADAAQWNGSLDGMLTIDSIDFASSLDQDAKVWLDAVSYNADGNLNAIVPEPIQFSSLLLCGTIGLARRRSRK